MIINVPHLKPRSLVNRLRHAVGLTDEWHGHLRPGYSLEGIRTLLGPRFEIERSVTYSKAFSELMDTTLNGLYLAMQNRKGDARGSSKGTVVTQADMRKHRKQFLLLSALYPVLWGVSKLDSLLFLPGVQADRAGAAGRLSRSDRGEPARLRSLPFPPARKLGAVLALLGAAAILRLTLVPDPSQAPFAALTPFSCLVCGEHGGADVLLNLLLFAPMAAGLRLFGWSWRRCVAACAALSMTVELLQFTALPGRDASLSDLLTNTAGGAMGAWVGGRLVQVLLPDELLARRLLLGGIAFWLGAIGFRPSRCAPGPRGVRCEASAPGAKPPRIASSAP